MPMPEPTEPSAPKRATTCPAVGQAQRGAGAAGRGAGRAGELEDEVVGGRAAGGRELCDDDVGEEGVRVDVELEAEGVRVDAEGDGVVARGVVFGGVDWRVASGARATGAGAAAT
jgi:hypothetical protein